MRKKIPKSKLQKRIDDYFGSYLVEHCDEIADIESLAVFIGMTREEFMVLENDENTAHAIKIAKAKIAAIKKQLAFKGKIPATVLAFDLKNNHGYRDKSAECEPAEQNILVLQGDSEKWSE